MDLAGNLAVGRQSHTCHAQDRTQREGHHDSYTHDPTHASPPSSYPSGWFVFSGEREHGRSRGTILPGGKTRKLACDPGTIPMMSESKETDPLGSVSLLAPRRPSDQIETAVQRLPQDCDAVEQISELWQGVISFKTVSRQYGAESLTWAVSTPRTPSYASAVQSRYHYGTDCARCEVTQF
jgi:hypothetical protein